AVGYPRRVRSAVVDETVPRQRPAADERCGYPGGCEQEPSLDTLAREHEPEGDHDDPDGEPRPREREEERERCGIGEEPTRYAHPGRVPPRRTEPEPEHERHVGDQPDRVPVPDRLAQPT